MRNGFAGQDCGKTFINPHRNLPPCFVETSRLQSNYVLLKLRPPGRDAKLSECILNEENCSSEQNPKRVIETMVCIVQLALFTDNSRRISVTSSRKPSKASVGVPRNTARHGGEIRLRIFFLQRKPRTEAKPFPLFPFPIFNTEPGRKLSFVSRVLWEGSSTQAMSCNWRGLEGKQW